MDKVLDLSKNNKYFWFYPKNKKEIKLIYKNNSKVNGKKNLKEKLNKYKFKSIIPIVLLTIKYREKKSKLYPENSYVIINFFEYKNNRIYELKNTPGKVFFKNSFLEKNKFKTLYLKNIVKKFYFDQVKTALLNFKYYGDL